MSILINCTGLLEFLSLGAQDALFAKNNVDTACTCKRVSFRDTVLSSISWLHLKVAAC